MAVTHGLVVLYWQIGRDILVRQEREGWGTKIIDRLAGDLRRAYPDMTGLLPRNLKYMRAFAEALPKEPIVQQLVAQIPWGHCVGLSGKTTLAGVHKPCRVKKPSIELRSLMVRLREVRERMGRSLTELSERTGLTRAAISRLENGWNLNPTL